MHSSNLLIEEPIRMISILEPAKSVTLFILLSPFLFFNFFLLLLNYILLFQSFFPAMTKIVGTLGPKSRSVDVISSCLKAGMSGIYY
jgi:pyruvate kinase